jgi:hypothetical protein
MALSAYHPRFGAMIPDWVMARDFTKGERAVKAKRTEYLPPTKGMILDGFREGPHGNVTGVIYGLPQDPNNPNYQVGTTSAYSTDNLGLESYNAYLLRANFPEYMSDALEIFMGMLHNKSPVIELPDQMEALRGSATELGEPLELLLQRINLEQLTTGRVGLLVDMPLKPDPVNPLPFIALYVAEAIRNWDNDEIGNNRSDLNFVVLNESSYKRQEDFIWKGVEKYRVLMLDAGGNYIAGAFEDDGGTPNFDQSTMRSPSIRGRTLKNIPFFFVNSKDIAPDPDDPPLIGLARLCGSIYRGEADYRQNLFMQGQDTLVIIGERSKTINPTDPTAGGEEPLRTGAGSRIELEPGSGVDAKYIGVQSQGLTEQRYALENDRKRAESRSGQLIDAAKGDKESGTALKTRVGAQTATLNQIAKTGALALELALKQIATWIGADPKKVKVQPNLEFADYQMSGQDLVNLMTAKRTMGAPLSLESVHRLMVQGNLTMLDYQTESAMLDTEPDFQSPEAKLALETAKLAAKNKPPQPLGPGPAPKDPSNPAPTD